MKQLSQYLSVAIVLSAMFIVATVMTMYIDRVYESALKTNTSVYSRRLHVYTVLLDSYKYVIVSFNGNDTVLYEIILVGPDGGNYRLTECVGNGSGTVVCGAAVLSYINTTRYVDGIVCSRESLIIARIPNDHYLKIYSVEGVYIG